MVKGIVALLHVWRLLLLCATISHERDHPALAFLLLVPLNHLLYNLTARLQPDSRRATGPAGPQEIAAVTALHLLGSIAVVSWYGSLWSLSADLQAFSRTWGFWVLVIMLIALDLVYRPMVRALKRVVGATGLLDSRLWSALFLAIAVWIWCDGVFAAGYQRLSLYCRGSTAEWCAGGQLFSEPLDRFIDAAYFSTITLSTTGYGDILPLSDLARGLVALEIVIGFGLLGFLLSRVAGFVAPASPPGEAPSADLEEPKD